MILHPDVAATARVLASIRLELAAKRTAPNVESNEKAKRAGVPSR